MVQAASGAGLGLLGRLVRFRRLATFRHVPETYADVCTGIVRLPPVNVAAVVFAVQSHGVNDDSIREATVEQRIAGEGIGRNLSKEIGRQLLQRLRPVAVQPAIALGG